MGSPHAFALSILLSLLLLFLISSLLSPHTMKLSVALAPAVVALHLPLLVSACHEHYKRMYPRQVSASAAPSPSLPPTVSVSLLSQNPTAVPLASISAGQPTSATIALPTSYAPGSTPSAIPNAPPLPDSTSFFQSISPLFCCCSCGDRWALWEFSVERVSLCSPSLPRLLPVHRASGLALLLPFNHLTMPNNPIRMLCYKKKF